MSDDDCSEDSFVWLRNVNPRTKDWAAEIWVDDPLVNLQMDVETDLFISNDPPWTEPPYHFPVLPHQDDWGEAGKYCGDAKSLKTLTFGSMEGIPVLWPWVPGVTKENLVALCKGGLHRNKSIKSFSIECGDFLGGRGFLALSSFFERTTTLESMSFIECEVAAIENDDFSTHLAGALAKFSSLKSFESHVNPRMAHKVLESLAGHKGLETIHLRSDTILGKKASSALSTLFRGKPKLSSITLELRRDHCNYMFGDRRFSRGVTGMLGDGGINALSSGLCGKNSVTHLTIIGNQNVSSVGWGAFATLLKSSRSVLQKLSMPLNAVGDEGAILIANALSENKVLREIDLATCTGITARGWRAFCGVFESGDSALQTMTLWDCRIDWDVYICWANALANNKRLKRLDMTYGSRMSFGGMAAFERILCNKSTIMDTFLSNHTLQAVWSGGHRTPNTPGMDRLLKINKDNSAFDAAREKIIMHHSREVAQIFKAMESGTLPDALTWMGKCVGSEGCPDDGNDEWSKFSSGSSMLYDFLRAMPGLFEGMNAGGARKRKRE